MKPLWARPEKLLSRFVQDVPIELLRHDTKPVHVAEGYGGRPIEEFPPCRYFQLHMEQRQDEAQEQFRSWYRNQFRKYSSVDKEIGGLRNGSLYRLITAEHDRHGVKWTVDPPDFNNELVEKAIDLRVEQRFNLLRAICEQGYRPEKAALIVAISRFGSALYLTGGHHRAAALIAIGRSVLPGVLVLSPLARRTLRRFRIV